MRDRPVQSAILATLACGLLLGTVFFFTPSAEIWANLTPGNCPEYCERFPACDVPLSLRPALQQPWNCWSNLAFVFVGFLAAFRRPNPAAYLFALSCLVLGIGSFLFHASVTYEFQWLDVVGMYLVLVAIVVWGLRQTWGTSYGLLLPVAAVADLLLGLCKWRLNTTLTLGSLGLGVAALMAVQVRAGHRSAWAAWQPGLLFAVAYLIRELDVRKVFCDPYSWLYQGHAVWHFLCATAVHQAFDFFPSHSLPSARSEFSGLQGQMPGGAPND